MPRDQKYVAQTTGEKEISLKGQFVADAPAISVNAYRRPWDTPGMIAEREKMAANLALSILDVDVNERASLYTQLPDEVLSSYQKASEKLHMLRHECLKWCFVSIPTAGISTTIGLTMGFNAATMLASGAGVLGAATGIIKFYMGEKARTALVDVIDQDLKDREIRPIQVRDSRIFRHEPKLGLEN